MFLSSFSPGGKALVQCVRTAVDGRTTSLITLDTVTDTVVANETTEAMPYVSPDVAHMVLVEETSGRVLIHKISEYGKLVYHSVLFRNTIMW